MGGRGGWTWVGLRLLALVTLVAACGPAPSPRSTAGPTATPGAALATPTLTPVPLPGPIASLPPGCAREAAGRATDPRVSIRDITVRSYLDYDALLVDFDRGLPEWEVTPTEPPFTGDPSGLPLEVEGAAFFRIVLRGASIVDDEFQPVYEGPTDLRPDLTRIVHVVLVGDFEAVSTWLVGLRSPACTAVQPFAEHRLVIAFFAAP
jgi:hypothetical protein